MAMPVLHLFHVLEAGASRYAGRMFVQTKRETEYAGYTFREFHEAARRLGGWLLDQGFGPGDRIGILSEARPEWGVAFFAIQAISATAVPIDVKLKEGEWRFILENSGSKALFISRKFEKFREGFPRQVRVVSIEEIGTFVGQGDLPPQETGSPAAIVYTSGTTGNPKGVMISHGNFLAEIEMVRKRVWGIFTNRRFLSILPLNHLFELTGGLIMPLAGGSTVTYAESLKVPLVLERMRETRPEIMLVVPAFLELLRREIARKAATSPPPARQMFQLCLSWGRRLAGVGIPAGWLFFQGLHARFGGKMRYFICGGAPLDPETQREFDGLGFTVLEGYGLTETSPILSVNAPRERRIGSVGRPLDQVEVRIEELDEFGRGEIVVRGPNVMLGYYGNPEATAEVLKDGWFHTGDIGYLDPDGFLHISGRKKNLIVTSAGKKISPEEVEEHLLRSPYIREACVVGKRVGTDEEVYALLLPDLDRARADGVEAPQRLRDLLEQEIRRECEGMAPYKRVKEFVIWEGEFPKTTTLKLRRKEILTLFLERCLETAEPPR